MSLKEFIDKFKRKRSIIEGSVADVTPVDTGDLAAIMEMRLDPKYSRQFSFIRSDQLIFVAIMDAIVNSKNELDKFLALLNEDLQVLSSSVDGETSKQFQNIVVGQMHQDFELRKLAVKYGQEGSEELKGVFK